MIEISEYALNIRHFQPHTYQRLVTTTILRVLAPYLRRDRITLDVGGNTGHMAYFFADYSKEVHSFEAVEIVYERLKQVEAAKPNVTVHKLAVADFCGTATFFVDDKRLSNSGFLNLVDGPPVEVEAATLDSLGYENVGFIKVDVEGTELDVLRGAEGIISRDRPNCMIEIYKPYTKYPINAIFDHMFERNYSCFYYDHSVPEGLVSVPDTAAGVDAVEHRHAAHDGDFLFVAN